MDSKEAMTQTSPKAQHSPKESKKIEPAPSIPLSPTEEVMNKTKESKEETPMPIEPVSTPKPEEIVKETQVKEENSEQTPIVHTTTNISSETNEATDDESPPKENPVEDQSKPKLKQEDEVSKEELTRQAHQSVDLSKLRSDEHLFDQSTKLKKKKETKEGCCTIL